MSQAGVPAPVVPLEQQVKSSCLTTIPATARLIFPMKERSFIYTVFEQEGIFVYNLNRLLRRLPITFDTLLNHSRDPTFSALLPLLLLLPVESFIGSLIRWATALSRFNGGLRVPGLLSCT